MSLTARPEVETDRGMSYRSIDPKVSIFSHVNVGFYPYLI